MAKNNLHDVLRNLGREETPPDIRRMAEEVAGRLRQGLAQTKQREHPIWREYIMRNRIVQLVAVVAIVAGVAIVSQHLGVSPSGAGLAGVAWGEVRDKIESIPVITCKMRLTMDYPEGRQWVDESDIYIGREYGSRVNSYKDGRLYMIKYVLPARKVLYFVHPQLKRYMERTLSDEEAAGVMEEQDLRQQVKRILAGAYSQLGRSEIDGIEVEGVEARSDTEITRLWVDVKTNWPVRVEVEGQMMSEGQRRPSHIVIDHFRWEAEIDPSLFEPNIPADYTLSGPR
jgi:outer membrane lipoprotein-sorting protein